MKFTGIKDELPFESLDEIFEEGNDPHGLLKSIKPHAKKRIGDSAEARKFEEINQFYDHHQREPDLRSEDFEEELLARALKSIREMVSSNDHLLQQDRHQLLGAQVIDNSEKNLEKNGDKSVPPILTAIQERAEAVTSLEDIFNQAGSLLESDPADIFKLKHIPKIKKEMPDDIAERKPCEDFWRFESLFEEMHQKLKSGKYSLQKFSHNSQIRVGDFFVLNGVSCLVDSIGKESERDDYYNPRLRLIFENGMESNMLMRSLAASLYKDENGRRIMQDAEAIEDSFNQISHRDKPVGYLYILRSLGKNPALTQFEHLYKIGYTTTTIQDRIKNANNDIAFLEAPVEIVTYFECFHINPQKLERLTHTFLEAQRLTLTLIGKDGKYYQPKEWFNVPLETIKAVIAYISNGTINQYRMDNTTGKIIHK